MTAHAYLEHGLTILKARLESPISGAPVAAPQGARPFITLSREVCAGATTLGRSLLPGLNSEFCEEGQEWVLLNKDLLGFALARHDLPEQLARYLPEDKISEIDAAIGEIVGLHPSIWELEQRVAQTIVQLAHLGYFIFAGRAAHLLTQSLPGGFHVRLVAAKKARIERLMEMEGCDSHEAETHIDRTDGARRKFVTSHFGRDIDDPHTYDLVINTDRISPGAAAAMVLDGLRHRMSTARSRAPAWTLGTWAAESDHPVWSTR
ncbi:MAG: cytidylate kinase-like family protein [Opitutaceae bacterium]|jgi:cytidylate kinase